MKPTTKKQPTITLGIKRLGINGEGIAYYQNKIVFVKGALPKEKVLVRIQKDQGKFMEGKLVKILKENKERQVAPCPIYDTCGGCQLQHLSYQGQLAFKKDLLKQALHKFKPAGYENFKLLDTIGMDDPWHYRNKAQYQVRNIKKRPSAGLFKENSHDLVELTNCLVQMPQTQEVINFVMNMVRHLKIPVYDERKNEGFLKTLMVRTGLHTNETQLVFITHEREIPHHEELITEIPKHFPNVVSIMQNIQPTASSVIFGDNTYHLWGKETIEDKIDEVTFDLSPRAFYQLNPKQTKVLYDEAKKALDLKKEETLVDAYCGVGTIGLSMAHLAKEVRGMDVIAESIEDAKKNAARMNVTNTHYETGKAEELLPKWLKEGFKPDAIVVDPPRTGLDKPLLDALIKYPVKKLVYVSCNVSTLARDLVTLSNKYQVEYLQSVDMFPHTARCEVVVKLRLK